MIKKSPYLFFLIFESMYYKYLPCQILSQEFDKKSDFLNYEFSSSKERVGSREDVTSSIGNQTTQQLDGIIFSKASIDKRTHDKG